MTGAAMSQLERTKQLQHQHPAQDIIRKPSKGFSGIFWQKIHAGWSHLHIVLFHSFHYKSLHLPMVSYCVSNLAVLEQQLNCSTLCKSKHWKTGDANHQWYLQRRWNSTLLFLRVHAVASFRNIWQACSTRISACLQAPKRRLWLP